MITLAVFGLYGGATAPSGAAAQQAVQEAVSEPPRPMFELLASGPSLVHFVVTPPPATLGAVNAEEAFTRVAIDGYEDGGAPGEPALPRRIFWVAVPPEGEVRVRANGLDPRVMEDLLVAPQPFVPRGEEASPPRYERLPAAYALHSAGPRVRLLGVSWMRNQRVARLAVSPVDYDAAARRITVYGRVDIQVEMGASGWSGPPAEDPDPFEGVYREVLVNYEQGKRWRRSLGPESAGRTRTLGSMDDTASVFIGRPWIKIPIPSTGFYRIDFGALRLLDLFAGDTTISVDSLRLFALPGYPVLSEVGFCDTCDFREVAIGVIDDGDGRLDQNDEGITFFALGASDWEDVFDPARRDSVYLNHPYETLNYYYLTVVGREDAGTPDLPGPPRRIATRSGAVVIDGGEFTPATFTARAHFEVDSPTEYFPDPTAEGTTLFWEKWYWRSLNMGGTFSTDVDLPGIDPGVPAQMRLRLWGVSSSCPQCPCALTDPAAHLTEVVVNGVPLGRVEWGDRFYRKGMIPFTVDTLLNHLTAQGNRFQVSVPRINCSDRVDRQAIAWLDVFYPRRFVPHREVLSFSSPEGMASLRDPRRKGAVGDVDRTYAGNYLYRIGPFANPDAQPPRLFDVTDAFTPAEIAGEYGAGFLSFETTEKGVRRYRAIQDTSFVEITAADLVMAPSSSNDLDLRSRDRRANYIIIYYDGFEAAAESLVAWRRAHNGFEALKVPISALYDQFSGGRTDPAAIRGFLRAAWLRWARKPVFVTLLGDASYDFKNYKGRAPVGLPGSLMPSYENGFDDGVLRQYATDDWMLNVTDRAGDRGPVPDFLGARIPAPDLAGAMEIVRDKVLLYERTAPFGEYRNSIMLIADDAQQGSRHDDLGWTHVSQTNSLNVFDTPVHMDRVYVYLHKYPVESGFTKPRAKADILANINGPGITLFNYIGHGSPFQISDERVLLDTDAGSFSNPERLPLFVAASCDVGKFNDPTVLSLGERLMLRNGGGTIGVISSTEVAYSNLNALLNQAIYRQIFRRDSLGQYVVPVSEALLRGKSGSDNSQKYQLLGDAATVLNLPHLWTETTLHDSAGTNLVSSLVQGSTVTFRSQVLDRPGGSPVAIDGVASILIEDSAPTETTPPCPFQTNCFTYSYRYKAGPIYRGEVALVSGRFEGRFVVPLDSRLGTLGRVRAYVTGTRSGTMVRDDAVGAVSTRLVAGTGSLSDVEGPRITLGFPGGATEVRPDAVLRVSLSDPSGILITGHSPQNSIIVTIDDNSTTRVDITPTFRYAADSHTSGSATFKLPSLPAGPHRIKVSAADNLALGLTAGRHRSSAIIDFVVQEVPDLRIAQAVLFPNPIVSRQGGAGAHFVIDTPGDAVNALVRVYTVSGRLVRTLEVFGGQGQIQVPWDGLDQEGQELANGVYLFKVHVNVREDDGGSSARQRAVAEGRIVVVGH